jgi:hypothetical protein
MTPSIEKNPLGSVRRTLLLLLPVVLLAGIIALFLGTGGGLNLQSAAPVERLDIERYVLADGGIELHIRNTGPQAVEISQAVVNAAVVRYTIEPSGPLARFQRAVVHLHYPWSYGEAYAVSLFTSNAIAFNLEIPVAFETPVPDSRTFWGFPLIGLYVGVIPVLLGMFWFPALRSLGRRTMTFLMAATIGLLVFLGLDTLAEALDGGRCHRAPRYRPDGIGAVGTYMLLEAVAAHQTRPSVTGEQRLRSCS